MDERQYFQLRLEIAESGVSTRKYLGSKRATYSRYHKLTGLPAVKGNNRFFEKELEYLGVDPTQASLEDRKYPGDIAAQRILARKGARGRNTPKKLKAEAAEREETKAAYKSGMQTPEEVLEVAESYPDDVSWLHVRCDVVTQAAQDFVRGAPKGMTYTAEEYMSEFCKETENLSIWRRDESSEEN